MKVFWSWQSDIDGNISRHFIKECIKKAAEELNEEASFSDRSNEIEIDHDTKDIPGSPPITDTILSKIENSSVFIADVTPVAKVKGSGKKIMNPNVAIEMGYAISAIGNNKIVTILNESFGSIDDLPFDLKYKRGPITYNLKDNSDKIEVSKQKDQLVTNLKISLKNYLTMDKKEEFENNLNLDKNGHAIFFDEDKPVLRLSGGGWSALRDKPYFFKKANSYIYIKIIPFKKLNFPKKTIKEVMFNKSNFTIFPLFSSPDNTPEVNRYGAITVRFDKSTDNKDNDKISDFVQILENGSLVSISNSFLEYTKNKIYLTNFKDGLEKIIKQGVIIIKNLVGENDKIDLEIEIGLINGDSCSIVRPNPSGNRIYPEPEVGPLENENYILSQNVKLNDDEKISKIVKEFIMKLMNDIGVDFDYDNHNWR